MAIWCIWSAPLYMSNDLRRISSDSSELLKNRHLIAIDQDKLGVWGQLVAESEQVQAFVKPVLPVGHSGCPSFALVYLNRQTLGSGAKVSS